MSAVILPFRPRFDPGSADAEPRYDGVVVRINRLTALRREARRDCARLEREFVENDLAVRSGPRRGQPLTRRGRRLRLDRLLERSAALRELDTELERLHAELDRMNRALDSWAREQWGPDRGAGHE